MPRGCAVCKARDRFELDERSGALVCLECGTQVANFIQEVVTDADKTSGRRVKVKRLEKGEEISIPKVWPDAAQVFEAFQRLLQKFLSAVMAGYARWGSNSFKCPLTTAHAARTCC